MPSLALPLPCSRPVWFLAALALICCIASPARAGQLEDALDELCAAIAPAPCPEDLLIGVAAYVYGYPLAMVEVTKNVATNVADATSVTGRAPINQFSHNGLPDQSYKDVVLPSVSTPYSNAFLDLSRGPIVLHIPPIGEMCQLDGGPPCVPRFFLMQMIDGWTNVGGFDDACINDGTSTPPAAFCGLGSRYYTTPGDYALIGPGWKGTLPASIKQVVRFETNTVWIAGRHLTNGTAQDMAQVRAIQQQYALVPLDRYGKQYTPTTHSPVDPRRDMSSPRDQINALDAGAYFKLLADVMRNNPPAPADAAIVAAMAKIGIIPGRPFDIKALDKDTQQALERAAVIGLDLIEKASTHVDLSATNWNMALDLGTWDTKYLERAGVAYGGLGANLFKDAVYAGGLRDQNGDLLSGDSNYTLTFAPGQYPPVSDAAFWSVTLYQRPTETLYDNAIGRNALGIPPAQGHALCPNADQSIVLYIQNEQPVNTANDPNAVCNWIPSPAGSNFLLLLRMYWPMHQLFDPTPNNWIPPFVMKQ